MDKINIATHLEARLIYESVINTLANKKHEFFFKIIN